MDASQCRAARALLDWTQQQLADAARVGNATIRNFEAGRSAPQSATIEVLEQALRRAGVEFIAENGGGAGVRLNKRSASTDHPKPVGPATDAFEAMDEAISRDRKSRKP